MMYEYINICTDIHNVIPGVRVFPASDMNVLSLHVITTLGVGPLLSTIPYFMIMMFT